VHWQPQSATNLEAFLKHPVGDTEKPGERFTQESRQSPMTTTIILDVDEANTGRPLDSARVTSQCHQSHQKTSCKNCLLQTYTCRYCGNM